MQCAGYTLLCASLISDFKIKAERKRCGSAFFPKRRIDVKLHIGTQGKAIGTLVSFEELGCEKGSESCTDDELRKEWNARGWTGWIWLSSSNKACSVWDVNLGNATVDTGGGDTPITIPPLPLYVSEIN